MITFYQRSAFFTLVWVFMVVVQGLAQEFTIGAQIRPRGEFRNGFKTLTDEDRDAAFFIEQRSRIFAGFRTDKFRVKMNVQDIRVWGAVDQVFKSDPSLFNVYEAWGEYFFTSKFSLRLGRMPLDYDNARFLGDLDWAAQGRSHDLALFIYEDDTAQWKLHAGTAFNQAAGPPEPIRLANTVYTGVNNYKAMQFAWFQKRFSRTDLSLLFQNDGRQVTAEQDTTVAFRQTYAAIANHKVGKMTLGGEFYYQGGRNAVDNEISAFLASAYITFKTNLTPLTLGMDHVSGTSLTDTKDNSFAPLYGTNHKFYGLMDYFYVGNFHGQAATASGLNDIFVKTNWKLNDKANLVGHLHYFSSPVDLYDPSDNGQEIEKYLGTEVDLVLVWRPADGFTVNLGYSQMFAGSSMEAIKATPGDHTALNNWAWFMVNFAPAVFRQDFSKN